MEGNPTSGMVSFANRVLSLFATQALQFVFAGVTSVILARALGPEGKGVVTLALLIPAVLVQLSSLGISTSNIYYAAAQRVTLSKLAGNSLFIGIVLGVIICVVFYVFRLVSPVDPFHEVDPWCVYIALAAVPFALVNRYVLGILLGKQKIRQINTIAVAATSLNLAGVAVLLILLHMDAIAVVALATGLSVLTSFLYLVVLSKLTEFGFTFSLPVFKRTVGFGLQSHAANLFSFLHFRIDMFMLAYLLDVRQLGLYSIAVTLAETILYIPRAISPILFPEVAGSDPKRAREVATTLCRNVLAITFAICLVLAGGGYFAIQVVFGPAFSPAHIPLLILLPGIWFISFGSPLSDYILGRGKPIFCTIGAGSSMVINIILNLLLLPRMGMSGAALASTVTYILGAVFGIVVFRVMSGQPLAKTLSPEPGDIRLYVNLFRNYRKRIASVLSA